MIKTALLILCAVPAVIFLAGVIAATVVNVRLLQAEDRRDERSTPPTNGKPKPSND